MIVSTGAGVHVGTEGLTASIFLLSVTVVILFVFLYTGKQLTRTEGVLLLGVYVLYVIYVIATNNPTPPVL
jgi:Ca2+/Na+ antiporter